MKLSTATTEAVLSAVRAALEGGGKSDSPPVYLAPGDGIAIMVALLKLNPTQEGANRRRFHHLRARCPVQSVGSQEHVEVRALVAECLKLRAAAAAGVGAASSTPAEPPPAPTPTPKPARRVWWVCSCERSWADGSEPDACPSCGRASKTFTVSTTGKPISSDFSRPSETPEKTPVLRRAVS